MATPGQNVSSKTKNMFRRAMIRLRYAKAVSRAHSAAHDSAVLVARTSARELNEDLLEIGLAHLAVADEHGAVAEPLEDVGQTLLR